MQRKRAVPTVVVSILSRIRQLGRGSTTLCVGAFALTFANLSAVAGPQPAPATAIPQPPVLQAAATPAPEVKTAPETPKPAPAESARPAPADPPKPAEAAKPAAEAPKPTPAPVPAATQTPPAPPAAPPAPQAAARTETPAPPPPPKPNAPKPNDELERIRKAAALLVEVTDDPGAPQSPYGKIIYDIAIRHSINPQLVAALIHVESAFNPRAVSPKGAYGLMQLLPETARRFGLKKKKDLFDPKKNLEAGVRYLKWLADRFGGDATKILAAYNAGEGAVERFGGIPPYQETQSYVQKIFGLLGLSSAPDPQPQAADLPGPQGTVAAR